MTEDERQVLIEVEVAGGKVGPKTFVGRGFVVSWCVRKGWLDWERANPRTTKATALLMTDKGREAMQANAGRVR